MYPLFIDFSVCGDREQFKTTILLYIMGYLMPTLSTLVKYRYTLFSVKLPRYRAGTMTSQASIFLNHFTLFILFLDDKIATSFPIVFLEKLFNILFSVSGVQYIFKLFFALVIAV